MHKQIIPASFFIMVWLIMAASPCAAAEYRTPLFPSAAYPPRRLTWILTGTTQTDGITLAYQTKVNPDDADSWQEITPLACDTSEQTITCNTDFTAPLDRYVQLALTYPDEATLETFNLTLESSQTESPAADHEQIYYSDFKALDPALTPTTLSWREQALIYPPTDHIIVQTRASSDNTTWSAWSGNADTLDLDPETAVTSVPGQITITSDQASEYNLALVSYVDEHNLYTLTAPTAAGATEADAFTSRTLALDHIDGLHLGDTIELTETVGAETFRARGIIADIKTTSNEITVFSWQGAIPTISPSSCGEGNTFCYSPSATIHRLATTALTLEPEQTEDEENTDTPEQTDFTFPIYAHLDDTDPITYTPQVRALTLSRPTEPTCLEYGDDPVNEATDAATLVPACRVQGINLTHYFADGTKPVSLQYRIIYGPTGDVTVTDVFLHQDTPADQALSSNIMITGGYRLRHGKQFLSGNSRPYYWR